MYGAKGQDSDYQRSLEFGKFKKRCGSKEYQNIRYLRNA